eukprot:3158914-Prorocentrum_lima.AAC.1
MHVLHTEALQGRDRLFFRAQPEVHGHCLEQAGMVLEPRFLHRDHVASIWRVKEVIVPELFRLFLLNFTLAELPKA